MPDIKRHILTVYFYLPLFLLLAQGTAANGAICDFAVAGKGIDADDDADSTMSIIFTGDVLLDRGVGTVIKYHGAESLFSSSVDSVFKSADMVVANLECPATNIMEPLNKRYIFRADPDVLPILHKHHITHLNLANNHTIDQNRTGLKDTYHNIINAGMTPIGYGDNAKEAARPLLISKEHGIYIISALWVMSENYVHMEDKPCINESRTEAICDTIKALKLHNPSARIVVCLHWGAEHTLHPMLMQRKHAHNLIDAGADAIVGHHSHTVQDIELYHDKPIFYSIGNFIFDQKRDINRKSILVKLIFTKDDIRYETIPVIIEKCVPRVTDVTSESAYPQPLSPSLLFLSLLFPLPLSPAPPCSVSDSSHGCDR